MMWGILGLSSACPGPRLAVAWLKSCLGQNRYSQLLRMGHPGVRVRVRCKDLAHSKQMVSHVYEASLPAKLPDFLGVNT